MILNICRRVSGDLPDNLDEDDLLALGVFEEK
jgi:hypothetical protein